MNYIKYNNKNKKTILTDIPLADTRLLEEHDLTNVLNQLPEDAFNELFEGKIVINRKFY